MGTLFFFGKARHSTVFAVSCFCNKNVTLTTNSLHQERAFESHALKRELATIHLSIRALSAVLSPVSRQKVLGYFPNKIQDLGTLKVSSGAGPNWHSSDACLS